MTSKSTSGIDMPLTQFWNPIAINNVEAQKNFYSRENLAALKLLRKEAAEPEKLDRLMRVYHDTLGYSIVRRAEEAKIALAERNEYRTAIQVASELVEVDISVGQMVEAIDAPKAKMIELVTEAIQQGCLLYTSDAADE